jgi:endonuclease G
VRVRCDVKRHALCCSTMPASSIIRAAFFALGAAVGGGAVVAISASKRKEASRTTAPNLPLAEVGVTGDPRLSAGVATAVGPVLKYGNPGMHAKGPNPFC